MQDPQITERQEFRERLQQTIQDARVAAEQARAQDGGRLIITPGPPVGVATTEPAWNPADIPPRAQEVAIASMFMLATIIIGFPLARALARRIDRTGISPKVPA